MRHALWLLALLAGAAARGQQAPRHTGYDVLEGFVGSWTIAGQETTYLETCAWYHGERHIVCNTEYKRKDGSTGVAIFQGSWEFNLRGIYKGTAAKDDLTQFWFHKDYLEEKAEPWAKGIVGWYALKIAPGSDAVALQKALDGGFANSAFETRTQTESALAEMQLKQLGDINFIANAIVGAVLFTLLFLTANTMMQSVRERTSELAVLKTLGFSDEKVLTLVLIEALILCSFAALIGLALASTVFMSPALKQLFGNFTMPLTVIGLGTGMAVLLACVSGFPPAWRARQLNIVDALAGR